MQKVDFVRETCRCGRPWNGKARSRLRGWVCERKQKYTHDEANTAAAEIRMDARGQPSPYKCPFGDHYHVGKSGSVITSE